MKQYINKSAVIAEIERRVEAIRKAFNEPGILSGVDRTYACAQYEAFKSLLSFLDTLEVKEVDFERDLSKYVSDGIHRFFPNVNDDYCKMDSVIWQDYVIETAKYLFELGLKAQREE